MSVPSNVALSMAVLQNRKRTQVIIAVIALVALVSMGSLLIVYDPITPLSETISTDVPNKALPSSPPTLAEKELLQGGKPEQTQASQYGELIAILDLLENDRIYADLVREIRLALRNNQQPTGQQLQQLNVALAGKVVQLNVALTQAISVGNVELLSKLAASNFFQQYAVYKLFAWSWLSTSAFEKYKASASALTRAEEAGDDTSVVESLKSIRDITGYQGYNDRISSLNELLASRYEEDVKSRMLSSMAVGDHDKVLALARENSDLVSRDLALKDLLQQAIAAKTKASRDESFFTALEQAESDDWEAAIQTAKSIPAELRFNEIDEIIETGERILAAKKTLRSLALKPDRLTDSNVGRYARQKIESVADIRPLSPSLDRAVVTLSDLLEGASETVTVNILSDSRATILIPRLGFIEPTFEKALKLTRSEYKFIVRCEGKQDIFKYLDLRGVSSTDAQSIRLTCES